MNITKEQFLDEVSQIYEGYTPSQPVLQQLGDIDLTTVCAPTGMGKDTLIAATGIPRVLAETIREPRVNNGVMEQSGIEYEFRGNELDDVLNGLRQGQYVQIGMAPVGIVFTDHELITIHPVVQCLWM